jgi:DNA invertase Pin-like site-specific DNA recombinase
MLIGYARVSTHDQNLDLQREALTIAGCEKIMEDQISGARAVIFRRRLHQLIGRNGCCAASS